MAKSSAGYRETLVRVVSIKRSARATKGGPRFSFSALVVVGDGHGRVGVALGKSAEVAAALQKGTQQAVAQMVDVSLQARTIPHEVRGFYCGAKVLLRPGSPGSGIIASREVRAVLQCAGVEDAVGKSLGAQNSSNVVKATLQALMNLRSPSRIYQDRGVKTPEAIRLPKFFKGPRGCELNKSSACSSDARSRVFPGCQDSSPG